MASFLESSLKRPEDLVSGNGFDDTVLDVLIAALCFRQPSSIHVRIRSAIELFPKNAQQCAFVGHAECLNVLLNLCEGTCHEYQGISDEGRAQRGGFSDL